MTSLKRKTEAAINAIREVHADTSGGLRDNLDALERLRDEVQELIDVLEEDIAGEG